MVYTQYQNSNRNLMSTSSNIVIRFNEQPYADQTSCWNVQYHKTTQLHTDRNITVQCKKLISLTKLEHFRHRGFGLGSTGSGRTQIILCCRLLKEQMHSSTWDSRIILCSEIQNRTVIPSQEPTIYESHVRIINTWNKNGLLCSRTQTHLVRNSTYTAKGIFVPSSPRALLFRTPRFKQVAGANRCHKTAIGLHSLGV